MVKVTPEIGSLWTTKPTKKGCHLVKVIGYEERRGLRHVSIERLKSTTGTLPTRRRGRLDYYTFYGTYQPVSSCEVEV